MKFMQWICAQQGTVQHQAKDFCFVALKFTELPEHHILHDRLHVLKIEKISPSRRFTSDSATSQNAFCIKYRLS